MSVDIVKLFRFSDKTQDWKNFSIYKGDNGDTFLTMQMGNKNKPKEDNVKITIKLEEKEICEMAVKLLGVSLL